MIKVVIADDEALMLQGFLNSIDWEKHGYKIVGAVKNPKLVLDICEKQTPDIAILDINMPGISGLDLLKELKQKYDDMVIIILSAYNNFDFARNALRYKADEYLLKPEIEFEDILEVMNRFKDRILKRYTCVSEVDKKNHKPHENQFYDLDAEATDIIPVPDSYDEIIRQLEVLISINDFSGFNKKVHEFFIKIEIEKLFVDDLLKYLIQIFFIFERKISKYKKNIDDVLEIENFNAFTELSKFRNYKLLKDWFFSCYKKIYTFFLAQDEFEQNRIVCSAIEYINKNITNEKLNLMDAAKEVNVSYSYLSRLFTNITGKNFNRYIAEMRMEKAKEMLSKSSTKINMIASSIGYQNVSYFIKMFKKYTGFTPTGYRESIRQGVR